MILINDVEVKPTIFPDGTSQVWKLDMDKIFNPNEKPLFTMIEWRYEQEVELIWVNQLLCLMYQSGKQIDELFIPYLPYGRQDKIVSNETTFAKEVFLEILLTEYVGRVTTLDAHSHSEKIESYSPEHFISQAITSFCSDANGIELDSDIQLVFPDKGALERYKDLFYLTEFVVMEKVRNQLTGKIESLKIDEQYKFTVKPNTKFLIVDDISDYGGTFVLAAKSIKDMYPNNEVGLYVTHFLGHGGNAKLYEAGISRIFTSPSLTEYRKFRNIVDDERVFVI